MNDSLPKYQMPSLDLLGEHPEMRFQVPAEEIEQKVTAIKDFFEAYHLGLNSVSVFTGPSVSLFKLNLEPGTKISSVKRLASDLAAETGFKGVRIVTMDVGVGVEIANDNPSVVPLRATLESKAFQGSEDKLPVAVGYSVNQSFKVVDLTEAPHVLIAGATKQGKTVALNSMILSLLYAKQPSELKFVFIDPKMIEFSAYDKLFYHYLAVLPGADSEEDEKANAIAKSSIQAKLVLEALEREMDERYDRLYKTKVNNIRRYNKECNIDCPMPYIVVVIDEFVDLTMSVGADREAKAIARSITTSIIRLAQKGRAAGIHLILATQRPSVDVITGLIKANFPTRIAFRVASRIDSQTILDMPGAEHLTGRGDMLFSEGIELERVQGAYVSQDEINAVVEHIGSQYGYQKSYNVPYYLPEQEKPAPPERDDMFEDAARLVVTTQKASVTDLQRSLGIGYARACRLMDQLESEKVVSPLQRSVLVNNMTDLEKKLNGS